VVAGGRALPESVTVLAALNPRRKRPQVPKRGFIICHLLPDNNHNQQQFLHVFTLFSAYQRLSVLPAFTTVVVDCHKHIMVVRQFL